MDDASGMAEGTPVRLNGITSRLRSIRSELTELDGPQARGRIQHAGAGEIPAADSGGFGGRHRAGNLLGDKFINITKGRIRRP